MKLSRIPSLVAVACLSGAAFLSIARAELSPQIPEPKGEECVRPTDEMRRDHMRFILHQRDETVHQGIRTEQFSLKHCIECHASKDEQGEWISPNTPEHFCQACHSYTGVKIDCFECHAGKP
jgi:hypothetical protein